MISKVPSYGARSILLQTPEINSVVLNCLSLVKGTPHPQDALRLRLVKENCFGTSADVFPCLVCLQQFVCLDVTSNTAFATSLGNASKFSTPFLLPSLSFSIDALVK